MVTLDLILSGCSDIVTVDLILPWSLHMVTFDLILIYMVTIDLNRDFRL